MTWGTGLRLLASLALLAVVGCAQGPADFVGGFVAEPTVAPTSVRSAEDREELARDLDSTAARQGAEGRAATGGVQSAVALAVIRQQQEEEARALLRDTQQSDAEPVPCAPDDPNCTNGVSPAN